MVDVYVRCIREGLITVDNVPEHWKTDVEAEMQKAKE